MIGNPNGSVLEAQIEALANVQKLLQTGKERYICFALREIGRKSPHLNWACKDLESHVKAGIEGHSSLQCFVVEKLFGMDTGWMSFPEPYKHDYYFNRGVMQMARLAWVDKLIHDLTTE